MPRTEAALRKRGLAGLWGAERGRAQAAPKHGVHGLAKWSNPRAQHPAPRCATTGVARVWGDGYEKHGRAPLENKGAAAPQAHRTAAFNRKPEE